MANFAVDSTRDQLLEKPLPHSAESERAILGAVILDNGLVNQAIELLKPDDFYLQAHRRVFQAMINLSERGAEINSILLGEELRRDAVLDQVGGITFITNLTYGLPHFTNLGVFAKIVRDKSMLRQLIRATNKITSEALEEEDEAEVILDHAEQAIFALADERTRQGFIHVKPIAETLLEKVQEMSGRSAMLTGLATGFTELDSMTSGLQPSDLIVVAARPSMGKCLTAHTLIDDPRTGERLTIEDYVKRTIPAVFGLSDAGEVRATEIAAWVDSGVKPCFRVRTRTGRFVEVTGHHPFLTVRGWTPLYDLQVGDQIGVPRTVPAFGTEEGVPRDLVRLMAYLIAEGGLTYNTCPTFTNTDPALVEDFRSIIAGYFPTCSLWKSSPNPLTEWLTELGLWGQLAEHKSLPACVWRWTRERLAEFLRVLLSCDGTIYSMHGCPRIEFTVASEKLAEDIHHALTRFGIISKLCWCKAERYWRLEITEPESVAAYQERIGWIGEKASLCFRELTLRREYNNHAPRDEAWSLVEAAASRHALSHTNRGLPLQRLTAYADHLNDANLQAIAGPDIYWDEITSIESISEQQVYDLSVPDGSNFIAQDICVHNTSLCLTLAQNAAIQAQAVVGVFSLEMSKESLVMRMLCSEGRVDAHRFRSGFLSREEWARLAQALGSLADAKIFIDDTPGITVLEMRAKARRLASEQKKLDLIIVDYMQLMSGSSRRSESRQQEVSQISRELKGLAKELNIPLIALSQLSRAPEARTDHRPQLADLRECIVGDSLITNPFTGCRQKVSDLFKLQEPVPVYSLNGNLKLTKTVATKVVQSGEKDVYLLRTETGREIRASANHPFLTIDGWRSLYALDLETRIAVPSRYPQTSITCDLHSEEIQTLKTELGLSSQKLGCHFQGKRIGRQHLRQVAAVLNAARLLLLANSDIHWDRIVEIAPAGREMTYDLMVPHTHNFVVNDIIVHNSGAIEQDADVVAFIYREEQYNRTEENAGMAELIVAKQRNGPTGTVKLAFLKEFTRFENMWRE